MAINNVPFSSIGGFTTNANVVANTVVLSGNVVANVILTDNYRYANGVPVEFGGNSNGVSNYANSNVAAYLPINTSNVSGNNFNVSGNVTVGQTVFANIVGNVTTGNINYTANSVSLGANARQNSTGINSVAVGNAAAQTNQGDSAIAVGWSAGSNSQGESSIAIGTGSAVNNQATNSIAVGTNSGYSNQSANAVAIGTSAGQANQGTLSVAVGQQSGQQNQGANAVAVGSSAGSNAQSTNAVALGHLSGSNTQGTNSVAVGFNTGSNTQGTNAISVGANAGSTQQGRGAVAVGSGAGQTNQGINSVAIGNSAGLNTQGNNSIAVGAFAGVSPVSTPQPANSIVINATGANLTASASGLFVAPIRNDDSYKAQVVYYNPTTKELTYTVGNSGGGGSTYGNSNVASYLSQSYTGILGVGTEVISGEGAGDRVSLGAVQLGFNAGIGGSKRYVVAIGYDAANSKGTLGGGQGFGAVAVGAFSGSGRGVGDQGENAIAIGYKSGGEQNYQSPDSIAIGAFSGAAQRSRAIAIGTLAAGDTKIGVIGAQGEDAIAIGYESGSIDQYSNCVAIGTRAGYRGQGAVNIFNYGGAVAIGYQAGYTAQETGTTAIGYQAGYSGQGLGAIAIGAKAGYTAQPGNSIIINATGDELNTTIGNSFVVKPIRYGVVPQLSDNTLYYDPNTGEITYFDTANVWVYNNNAEFQNYTGKLGSATSISIGQGTNASVTSGIAIGVNAGATAQGINAVAIGNRAAQSNQGPYGIAIGSQAGNGRQGNSAVAIGNNAGTSLQSNDSVAIGGYAGFQNQGANAIAIGLNAGGGNITSISGLAVGQGSYSIAIGYGAGADNGNANAASASNSITLNASGSKLPAPNSGFYVAPVRSDNVNVSNSVYYNTVTKEFTYGPNVSLLGVTQVVAGDSIEVTSTEPDGTGIVTITNTGATQVIAGDGVEVTSTGPDGTGAITVINSGVTQIIAGDGIIISSTGVDGTGEITINANIPNNISSNSISNGNSRVSIPQINGGIRFFANNVPIGNISDTRISIGNNAGNGVFIGNAITVAIGARAGEGLQENNSIILNASGNILNAANSGLYVDPISQNNANANIGLFYNTTTKEVTYANAYSNSSVQTYMNTRFTGRIWVGQDPNTGITSPIRIGTFAGGNGPGDFTQVAIGYKAGMDQALGAVAIGNGAGNLQGVKAVAIGYFAGADLQGGNAVAVGQLAGYQNQGGGAVAVGERAGAVSQGYNAVAIGNTAGYTGQSRQSIAIGDSAGNIIGANTIVIGTEAGNNVGSNCIIIGTRSGNSGNAIIANNNIIINATGTPLISRTGQSGFYVAPVSGLNRTVSDTRYHMYYNIETKEVTYSTINISWLVTGNSTGYTFTGPGFPFVPGQPYVNPTLYLYRGFTYLFDVSGSGGPLEIRQSNGGAPYTLGVSTLGGKVTFEVPMSAPSSLYYQSTTLPALGNTIIIV